MNKTKAWSFSQLNNFETCPKKYYHFTIAKDYKEEEGEALRYGKKVHKALENLIKHSTPLPPELAHMQEYVQKFVDSPLPKRCEQQLAIDKDFQPCQWKDWDNAWCRAVIDLALKGNKSALLIDYKTGSMKDDGFTQLGLAAAIYMAHNPEIETVRVGYLWTEHDGQITSETFRRAGLSGLWNELLPRVAKFQRAFEQSEYPPRPSGLCRKYCCITGCPHHGQ